MVLEAYVNTPEETRSSTLWFNQAKVDACSDNAATQRRNRRRRADDVGVRVVVRVGMRVGVRVFGAAGGDCDGGEDEPRLHVPQSAVMSY